MSKFLLFYINVLLLSFLYISFFSNSRGITNRYLKKDNVKTSYKSLHDLESSNRTYMDPNFVYQFQVYCVDNATIASPIFNEPITPGVTQVFLVNNNDLGLSIDTNTGEIDIAASTIGVYSLRRLVVGIGFSDPVSVEIIGSGNIISTIDYGSNTNFCKSEANPIPNITGLGGGEFTSTPGLDINVSTGEINLSNSTPGIYTVSYEVSGLCTATASQNISIINVDADFEYAQLEFCADAADPIAIITGTAGGDFTNNSGIVFSNLVTGEIDIDASQIGVHTINYTVTNGTCTVTKGVTVTIYDEDDAMFSYLKNDFCKNESNPLPTITGFSGGVFSSNIGLDIDAATGEINLANSTSGNYTVVYTTSVNCPNSSSQNIEIIDRDTNFSYAKNNYCTIETNPQAMIVGDSGGVFTNTSSSGLVFLDTSTGLIDIVASTIGIHEITYSISIGNCIFSTSKNVTITANDIAAFNYSKINYCQSEVNPIPTIIGTVGGEFTGTTGLIIDNITGVIDLEGSVPGAYVITYTTTNTCPDSVTQNVVIDEKVDSNFTYITSAYCMDETDPTPTITGTMGGVFSNITGIVFLNASTGSIDLSASSVGMHEIIYTVTNGVCQESSSFTINVFQRDLAEFNYDMTTYCQAEIDPVPTITGTIGGQFSSTTGLVIDNITGEIDLDTSTAGTYTITYTTTNTCVDITTQSITIDAAVDSSFAYPTPIYCIDDIDPIPTITGTPGGVFSNATGIIFINVSTGEINLSESPLGTHEINYTVNNGICNETLIDTITINPRDVAMFNYSATSYCITGTDPVPMITGTTGGQFSSSVGIMINDMSGKIDVSESVPGAYTITYTTIGTCIDSISQIVNIDNVPDASFIYDKDEYCSDEVNPIATVTGVAGGVFTNNTGVVFLNASTGLIDLNASTPGIHQIRYTVNNGTCTKTFSKNITIIPREIAAFTYDANAYCKNMNDPVPIITGTTGGEFSSTVGLMIDSTSGVIDISESVAGIYEITYQTLGACNDSTTQNITINEIVEASFVYDAILYCEEGINPIPTITGTTGGIFSNATGIVFLDVLTGEINLDNSPVGIHQITYTVTNGLCNATENVSIEIKPSIVSDFNYPSAVYCQLDANPIPIITGAVGGEFSSTIGLTIDETTGEIDLENSLPGVYMVSYEIINTCELIVTKNITIQSPNLTQHFETSINDSLFIDNVAAAIDVGEGNKLELRLGENLNGIVNWTGPNNYVASGTQIVISNNIQILDSGIYTVSIVYDIIGCGSLITTYNFTVNVTQNIVKVSPKIFLQGAMLNTSDELMRDDLRQLNYLPLTSPYEDGLTVDATIFESEVDNKNDIVDWILIELRSASDNTIVINQRSALLQRDGDIIDESKSQEIEIMAPPGDYYVSIKHRNHLGVMTASTVNLSIINTLLDFRDGTQLTYGINAQTREGMPSGKLGMWAGDMNNDGKVILFGPTNELLYLRNQILSDTSNIFNTLLYKPRGYINSDLYLDGESILFGAENDPLLLRRNILNHPSNGFDTLLYIIMQQLP